MKKNLELIHNYIKEGSLERAQDLFRAMICNLPGHDLLSKVYLTKAYEINALQGGHYAGLNYKQIDAHSLIVRQILIENSEEFDRRVSRLS